MNCITDAQLPVFPDQLMLCRIDSDAGHARFVYTAVQREMFGEAMLVPECGRIEAAGRLLRCRYAEEGQAVTTVLDTARVLARRGNMDGPRSKHPHEWLGRFTAPSPDTGRRDS